MHNRRLLVAASLIFGMTHLSAHAEITVRKIGSVTVDVTVSTDAAITHLQFDDRFGGIVKLGDDRLLRFDRAGKVTLSRSLSRANDRLPQSGYVGTTFLPNGNALVLFVAEVGNYITTEVRIITENGTQLSGQATIDALCGNNYNSFSFLEDRSFRFQRMSVGNAYSTILQAGRDHACDLKSRKSLSSQVPQTPGYSRTVAVSSGGDLTAVYTYRMISFQDGYSGVAGDNVFLQSADDITTIGPLASPFSYHEIAEFRIFPDHSLIAGQATVASRGRDAFLLALDTDSSRKIFARYVDFGSQEDEVIFMSRQNDAIALLIATGPERDKAYWFACFDMRGEEMGRLAIGDVLSEGAKNIGVQENGHLFIGYSHEDKFALALYQLTCP